MEEETQLPLTNPDKCVEVTNKLDLSKSYLFPLNKFISLIVISENKINDYFM